MHQQVKEPNLPERRTPLVTIADGGLPEERVLEQRRERQHELLPLGKTGGPDEPRGLLQMLGFFEKRHGLVAQDVPVESCFLAPPPGELFRAIAVGIGQADRRESARLGHRLVERPEAARMTPGGPRDRLRPVSYKHLTLPTNR